MANEAFLKQSDSKRYTNAEVSQMVGDLVDAERRIGEEAKRRGVRWGWALYSKPSTGGPYMWNDIVVSAPDGKSRTIQALAFVEGEEA